MICRPDGSVTEVDRHGTALGIIETARYEDTELTLGPATSSCSSPTA